MSWWQGLHLRLLRYVMLWMPKYIEWRENQTFGNGPLSALLWKFILRHYFWNYPYLSSLILSTLNNNYLHIPKITHPPPPPIHFTVTFGWTIKNNWPSRSHISINFYWRSVLSSSKSMQFTISSKNKYLGLILCWSSRVTFIV